MIMNGLAIEGTDYLRHMSRDTLRCLLRKGSMNSNHFGSHLPIQLALASQRFDLANLLLDFGDDLDARDQWGLGRMSLNSAVGHVSSTYNIW